MKKNKMMRLASFLLIAVLMTTSVISGTFAKYTTTVTDTDSARVAKWGFEPAEIVLDNLFSKVYEMDDGSGIMTNSVVTTGTSDVIAPGTTGSASFAFNFDETYGVSAPEVAYTFEIDIDATGIGATIKNNPNIQWQLDSNEFTTWDVFVGQLEALDGSTAGAGVCAPNTLPAAFNADGITHTISWRWNFDSTTIGVDTDEMDTQMGNADTLDQVVITVTVTAEQIN